MRRLGPTHGFMRPRTEPNMIGPIKNVTNNRAPGQLVHVRPESSPFYEGLDKKSQGSKQGSARPVRKRKKNAAIFSSRLQRENQKRVAFERGEWRLGARDNRRRRRRPLVRKGEKRKAKQKKGRGMNFGFISFSSIGFSFSPLTRDPVRLCSSRVKP